MSVSLIVSIAFTIVQQAIDSQASNVQMKLTDGRTEVYYHKEGAWHHLMTMPGHILRPLVTRYKLFADVDLLSRRYPLQGRFPLIHRRRHYNVDVTWEGPWLEESVTMSIEAGVEATEEEWEVWCIL